MLGISCDFDTLDVVFYLVSTLLLSPFLNFQMFITFDFYVNFDHFFY
jgi:hypothetical protein